MTMITLYRVENHRSRGPYVHTKATWDRDALTWMFPWATRSHSDWKHPTPSHDPGIDRYMDPEERCAFVSMEQLLEWFNMDELRNLADLGFCVNMLRVNVKHVTVGKHQALYVAKYRRNWA